jgi:ABC-2 type transport system ATP-binding protein
MEPHAIELHGLAKSFRVPHGVVEAVRGVDLSVAAGETVALLGPNGAGKSTTIDILLGLTPPDAGTVTVLGRAPRAAVEGGLIGVMLQSGTLIRNLAVRELVALAASVYADPMDVDDALDLAGIRELADRRTEKLSGGEAQRARFAVALVGNPRLLVLDEPTAGLDVEGRRAFWSAVRGFASRGRTVLFATHYLEEADAYADRAVLLAAGRVVADGPTSEIRARVGRRTITATLPGKDVTALLELPGVVGAERHGDAVRLSCTDSDLAIRALLQRYPTARDIEIAVAKLEEAFLELTAEPREVA